MSAHKIKSLYITSRIYAFISLICVALGIFVCIDIFFTHYNGLVTKLLEDPFFIATFIFSMVPAFVFYSMSEGMKKKYKKLMKKHAKSAETSEEA